MQLGQAYICTSKKVHVHFGGGIIMLKFEVCKRKRVIEFRGKVQSGGFCKQNYENENSLSLSFNINE